MIIKNLNKALLSTFSITLLATSTLASVPLTNSENCTTNPSPTLTGQNNASVDNVNLKRHLQRATNRDKPIVLKGTFKISQDIRIALNKDLVVDASQATFIAQGLNGDMFSIDTHSTLSKKCEYNSPRSPDVTWDGGRFEMVNAKISTVVPYRHLTPTSKHGTESTADALSIRGVNTSQGFHHLRNTVIRNITFYGTPEGSSAVFHEAGGDSGILLIGGASALITNNAFYGVRDAAIYVSAQGSSGQFGDNFTMTNNTVERAFDGITSKRGADNIKMNDNFFRNVAVPLSIKYETSGRNATNVEVKRNTIYRAIRAISLERTTNATVSDNIIREFGMQVADETTPNKYNKFGGFYEGVSFLGTQNSTISNNDFYIRNTVTGSNYSGYAMTERTVDGRASTGNTRTGNAMVSGGHHLTGTFKSF